MKHPFTAFVFILLSIDSLSDLKSGQFGRIMSPTVIGEAGLTNQELSDSKTVLAGHRDSTVF